MIVSLAPTRPERYFGAVTRVSMTSMFVGERPVVSKSLSTAAGYIALFLLLDVASYVEPVRHTGITPWNPNTGLAMALLLARGWRWAPVVAIGDFFGELLTEHAPFAWLPTGAAALYLAAVYTLAAWGLRRLGFARPIETPLAAAVKRRRSRARFRGLLQSILKSYERELPRMPRRS